jgi:hypothetical protein
MWVFDHEMSERSGYAEMVAAFGQVGRVDEGWVFRGESVEFAYAGFGR